MRAIEIELDLCKPEYMGEPIVIRSGEAHVPSVSALVLDGGIPIDLEGLNVQFWYAFGDVKGNFKCRKDGCRAVFEIPAIDSKRSMDASSAYIAVESENEFRTTNDFKIHVIGKEERKCSHFE